MCIRDRYTYSYDKAGRLKSMTSPLGYTKNFSYDKVDNVVKMCIRDRSTYRDIGKRIWISRKIKGCSGCNRRIFLTDSPVSYTHLDVYKRQVIKSELLYPKKLVFQSEDIYYSCMQETISLGEKNQKDGAEIIKEREQKAEAKQRKKRKGRSDAFD